MLNRIISLYRAHAPIGLRRIVSRYAGYHSPLAGKRTILHRSDTAACRATLANPQGLHPVLVDRAAALRALFAEFHLRGVRPEILGHDWWERFCDAIACSDQDGQAIQAGLIDAVSALPADRLAWWEWLSIYNIALEFGLFNLGHAIRCRSRQAAVAQLQAGKLRRGSHAHLQLLCALVEAREWGLLKAETDRLGALQSEEKYLFEFLLAMAGTQPTLPSGPGGHSRVDRLFVEFNRGRSIAFVGPASAGGPDAAEIDGFDVIVRANHKPQTAEADHAGKGTRCEISYYNGIQSERLGGRGEPLPAGLRFVMAVQRNLERLRSLPPSPGPRPEFRAPRNYRSLLLQGSFHGMPNAIVDLLKCQPARLKIFNADLMLTVSRHAGYKAHAQTVEQHARLFLNTLKLHDPLVQFVFLNVAYQSGRLEGDAMFSRVMDMGEAGYMQALQQVYGDFARLAPPAS